MKRFVKVLLGCCLLVAACAQMANAADEHPANAKHFSMLELNRKLSALILDKYPNSHIDADVFSINACNSQRVKDASTDNHSCLDSQVKPRPDSADFTLYLSVGVDMDQQDQMLYSSSSFAIPKSVDGNRYNFKILSERTDGEWPGVPDKSWIYVAFNELVKAGVAEPMPRKFSLSVLPVKRYEFAIAIARLLDKKSERAKDMPEVKEVIGQLSVEFAPEFAYLFTRYGNGLDKREQLKDGKPPKPRYEFLQLQFQSGSQFDPKLHKQIESTIAEYAAVSLKSKVEKATPKPTKFSLLELQKKLKRIILPKYPETIFERRPFRLDREPYSLIIHSQSDKYKSHITVPYGGLSREETGSFPTNLSEFILRLELTSDYYTYTHKFKYPSERPQPFGTTFMDQYKLKMLPDNVPGTTDISDTPDHRWVYGAYDLFVKAGLIDDTRPTTCMGCLPLTRMGFAIATARLTDDKKAQETIVKKLEFKGALKVLQQEFARELAEFGLYPKGLKTFSNGKTWPTRYEHLSLNFSYGKGFDPKLRKQIESAIVDYAAAWMKSNSSTDADVTQK